jgi:hypothetical protein
MALTCSHEDVRFNRSYDARNAARVRISRALHPLPVHRPEFNTNGQPSRDERVSWLVGDSELNFARNPSGLV